MEIKMLPSFSVSYIYSLYVIMCIIIYLYVSLSAYTFNRNKIKLIQYANTMSSDISWQSPVTLNIIKK